MSKFNTSQFNIEFVKNSIDFHAFVNFALEFFDLNTDFTNKLFSVSKFIDVFGDFVDFCRNFVKFGLNLVGFILGLLLNQLNFFIDNLLIFTSIEISDILAVNLEHADDNRLRN